MGDNSPVSIIPKELRERFEQEKLLPAIAQDSQNKDVLMMAWMNLESMEKSLSSGQATFWSRSRAELWVKGATSGNFLEIEKIYFDCDADTILLTVRPAGPACHTGARTCFNREIEIKR